MNEFPRVALAAIAACMASRTAIASEAPAAAAPVLVLAIERPWQRRLTPQPPDFVLYENRFAIQRRFVFPGPDEYSAETIDEARYAALISRLRVLTTGARWAAWYEPKPHPSDQPTTRIFARVDGTTIVSAVHGREACPPRSTLDTRSPEVPVDLCRLIDEAAHIQLVNAKRWVPQEVEVTLWREDGAPGWPKRKWPKKWLGIRSADAYTAGDRYTIRMGGGYLSDLDSFLKRNGRLGPSYSPVKPGRRPIAYRIHVKTSGGSNSNGPVRTPSNCALQRPALARRR